MTKRIAQTITLSVRIPLPPGFSPKRVTTELSLLIENAKMFESLRSQIIIRTLKKETVYL